jgi:hypothetical protein
MSIYERVIQNEFEHFIISILRIMRNKRKKMLIIKKHVEIIYLQN